MNARPARALLPVLVLATSSACNAISGASSIDLTRTCGVGAVAGANMEVDGGSLAFPISCKPGDVAVGVHGESGAWMNQLGLVCAPFVAPGKPGAAVYQTGLVGAEQAGLNAFSYQCPASPAGEPEVMVGMTYNTGSYVNQVQIQCQTVPAWLSTGQVETESVFLGGVDQGPNQGMAPVTCPASCGVFGLYGSAGQYVESFARVSCVPY